ncbi:MAG: LLM class flavin-dependent oxidoreductase, partial [Pseudomonadales bacterium]|nr:LLM class flavin-dependent oxidoreductase [Pseudomonadales bacterium]
VGVGGEFPVEFEAAGLNVKQRGRITNECLEVLRRLWTEENVSYQGRHFRLNGVTVIPRPAQKPHPPVWVSGRREPAMLRAAKFGDGWMPYFYDPDRYRSSAATITGFATEQNRDLTDFQWAYFPYVSIYDTVKEAAEVAAEALGGRYLYGGGFRDIVEKYCLLGPVESCIARIQEYIDAGATTIVFNSACPQHHVEENERLLATEVLNSFAR